MIQNHDKGEKMWIDTNRFNYLNFPVIKTMFNSCHDNLLLINSLKYGSTVFQPKGRPKLFFLSAFMLSVMMTCNLLKKGRESSILRRWRAVIRLYLFESKSWSTFPYRVPQKEFPKQLKKSHREQFCCNDETLSALIANIIIWLT